VALGLVGNDLRQGGFAAARRPHKMIDENRRSALMARRSKRPWPTITALYSRSATPSSIAHFRK
jgi:hypothetical protein